MVQSNEKLPDCNQNMEQSVEPHNDFFSAQFLLPFNVPGTHQVSKISDDFAKKKLALLFALISLLCLHIT